MPQVERVADPAQEPERRDGHQPGRAPAPLAGRDERRGAQRGEQRRDARVGRRGIHDQGRGEDRRQPPPAEQGQRRPGEPGEGDAGDGEQAAGRQLPGPGREQVEGPPGRGLGGDEAGRERCREDEAQDDGGPDSGSPAARPEQQEERPGKVELLLDAERPEVEERRGRADGREVVACRSREPEVGHRRGSRRPVERQPGPVERGHDHGGDGQDDRDRDERRRQQAPDAAPVEPDEVDATCPLTLPQQEAGDEEAGDDEEDVDAHEAARDGRQLRMEEEDEEDGDPAQALDVGPEGLRPADRSGGRGRRGRALAPRRR